MEESIFTKIVKGEIPSEKVYEDKNFLAFMDIMPAVKGHTLVIPKKQYETFIDIPDDIVCDYILVVKKVAQAVVKATKAKGYKVEMFNGSYAGQGVFHAHFHIIPRYEGEDILFKDESNWWVPQKDLYDDGEIKEWAQMIRDNL
ncbi:MAG: HIT family protein [Nanoarchaeota archaeon]